MIPVTVFKRLGLFDEINFPHYYGDHDFYLRCRKRRIPLRIAADAEVYIDKASTTIAADLHEMSARQFVRSLFDRRSHRNVSDLNSLFKIHYPIRGFHHLGLALNLARYFLSYAWKRLLRALT
jgi:GT2 family glycosyltransferase